MDYGTSISCMCYNIYVSTLTIEVSHWALWMTGQTIYKDDQIKGIQFRAIDMLAITAVVVQQQQKKYYSNSRPRSTGSSSSTQRLAHPLQTTNAAFTNGE